MKMENDEVITDITLTCKYRKRCKRLNLLQMFTTALWNNISITVNLFLSSFALKLRFTLRNEKNQGFNEVRLLKKEIVK